MLHRTVRMRPDRRFPVPALLLLAAFWGLAGGPLLAHELGPFQVYGTFLRGGTFRLEVRIDEEHLTPAQLGGPARPTRYGRIGGLGGPTERHFGRFLSELADSLTVSFDGARVRPTLTMDPPEAGAGGGRPAPARLGARRRARAAACPAAAAAGGGDLPARPPCARGADDAGCSGARPGSRPGGGAARRPLAAP